MSIHDQSGIGVVQTDFLANGGRTPVPSVVPT